MDQTELPMKNGLPWTAAYKFPKPANPECLERLSNLWHNQDWGANYENHKRTSAQVALYTGTRTIAWVPILGDLDPEYMSTVRMVVDDLQTMLPQKMTILFSELVLMVPNGDVMWHYDRPTPCVWSTRVIVPITYHGSDIKYYSSSWGANAPATNENILLDDYLDEEIFEYEMHPGHYYMLNHRVPHRTISKSDKPRGILMLEMMPPEKLQEMVAQSRKEGTPIAKWYGMYTPISEFERTKLLPPIV